MVFLLFTVQSYYSLLIKLFILVLYSNNINQLVLLYTHNKIWTASEFTIKSGDELTIRSVL